MFVSRTKMIENSFNDYPTLIHIVDPQDHSSKELRLALDHDELQQS